MFWYRRALLPYYDLVLEHWQWQNVHWLHEHYWSTCTVVIEYIKVDLNGSWYYSPTHVKSSACDMLIVAVEAAQQVHTAAGGNYNTATLQHPQPQYWSLDFWKLKIRLERTRTLYIIIMYCKKFQLFKPKSMYYESSLLELLDWLLNWLALTIADWHSVICTESHIIQPHCPTVPLAGSLWL